jgi:hypothetical protein
MRDDPDHDSVELVQEQQPLPFRWRGVWILTALFVIGNLLSVPQLIAHGEGVPPVPMWLLFTALNLFVVAAGQFFANRVGLGAPLIDGRLTRRASLGLSRKTILVAVLFAVVVSPFLVLYNRQLASGLVPQPELWRLVLASVDAGIQEETFNRFFLLSVFVWAGWRLKGRSRGVPTPTVYWVALLLSACFFAWDHVDGHQPNLSQTRIVEVLAFTGGLGIGFGWCFWKLGLECAILAHILVDAVGVVLVNAVYFPANAFVLPVTVGALIVAGVVSARTLFNLTPQCIERTLL